MYDSVMNDKHMWSTLGHWKQKKDNSLCLKNQASTSNQPVPIPVLWLFYVSLGAQ